MFRPGTPRLFVILAAAAVAGCGGDTSAGSGGGEGAPPPDGQTTQEQRPAESGAAGSGRSCDDITVPGHVATGVRAQGTSCDQVTQIVRAAVGRGRAAYEAAGFSCQPSPAGDGDTNYACTGDAGARVTFRYGAA